MNFWKTTILSGLSTIIRLLTGILSNKIIAIYIGPTGIALIGQFQNLLNLLVTLGNGGITNGVVKYVAEFHEDDQKRTQYIIAAFIITVVSSLITGFIILIFAKQLSVIFLYSEKYKSIFTVMSISILFSSINILILSILNGLKNIKLYILINIIGSILTATLVIFFSINYGLFGVLLCYTLTHFILCFIAIFFVKNRVTFYLGRTKPDKKVYKDLLNFSFMALVSILTTPTVQILIRNLIIDNTSIETAGIWQATTKVSELYLMVVTTALGTYYLPTLSSVKEDIQLRKEIIRGYVIIIPTMLVLTISIYFLRDFIIQILFTREFSYMRELFSLQLIGDFIKMCSWILAYLMIAKGKVGIYITTEIVFSIILYLLSLFFISYFGVRGALYAYIVNYFFYFITMIAIFKNVLFLRKQ